VSWAKVRTVLSALWRAAFLATFVVGVILLPADVVTIAGALSGLGDGLARVVVGIVGVAAILLVIAPNRVRAVLRPSENKTAQPSVRGAGEAARSEVADDPLERGLTEDIRKGERLRDRYRSSDPPGSGKAGTWATSVIERLSAHDEDGYVDRFHGSAGDQVHPPHDPAAQADYMDGRLDELRRILASLRGEQIPSEIRVGTPTVVQTPPRPKPVRPKQAPPPTPRHAESSPRTATRDTAGRPQPSLKDELEQALVEGRQLRQGIPDRLPGSRGLAYFALGGVKTTGEGIERWQANVENLLAKDRHRLNVFLYDPPEQNDLAGRTLLNYFVSSQQQQMDRRLVQLERVIKSL
jgi:hypothetical protein